MHDFKKWQDMSGREKELVVNMMLGELKKTLLSEECLNFSYSADYDTPLEFMRGLERLEIPYPATDTFTFNVTRVKLT